MAVTNEKKQEICEKYKVYLNIIYRFGNKVMLSKQLYEYALELNLVKYKIDFWKQIDELKRYDILKSETFVVFDKITQNQVLTLKKYAIRFIEHKEKSSQVSAVPKSNSNKRILLSIFKNKFILKSMIPILKKNQIEVTYENIITRLERNNCNILYNKNTGLEYMNHFDSLFTKEQKTEEFLISRYELIKTQIKREQGLCKGSGGKMKSGVSSQIDEGYEAYWYGNKLKSEEYLTEKGIAYNKYNFDRMFANNIYIAQIVGIKKNDIRIGVIIFDIDNSKNINKIALNIASIYNMFRRYLNCKFTMKVKIITYDQKDQRKMENFAYKRNINYKTKEKNELNNIQNYLKLDFLDDDDRNNIDIAFDNYDLANEYFDLKKYSNLNYNRSKE